VAGGHPVSQSGVPVVVAAAVPAARPSLSRPSGAKGQKLQHSEEHKSSNAVAAVAVSLAGLEKTMSRTSERKADLALVAVQAKLLEMLPEGAEKQRRVLEMLQRTDVLRGCGQAANRIERAGERGSIATVGVAGGEGSDGVDSGAGGVAGVGSDGVSDGGGE